MRTFVAVYLLALVVVVASPEDPLHREEPPDWLLEMCKEVDLEGLHACS